MFTKSWSESKEDINFYLNHNDEQAPGKVVDVYEDGSAAYTKAWLGTHTLGNDVLTMMDEGVIKKASFGYITKKANKITVKGRKVRELKEVAHIETSVLTKLPCNPSAGVRSVVKSLAEIKALSSNEQSLLKRIMGNDQTTLEDLVRISATLDVNSDLYTWISWQISRRADAIGDLRSQLKWNSGDLKMAKAHLVTLENFCRNTNASDECIKGILDEVENTKTFIAEYNTALTEVQPGASGWAGFFNN